MSEWPRVCTSCRHVFEAIPAAGRYVGRRGESVWYCRKCAIDHGPGLNRQGYKWEPLPDSSQAQPTSEREQP